MQRAVEPAIGGGLQAGRTRLHEVLRVEMRARWIGGTHSVHDGEVMLVPQRQERRHGRVQSEEAVKVHYLVLRNIDAGAHRVIRPRAMRYDDIQYVRCAPLEDHDQALRLAAGFDRTVCSPSHETWDRSGANDRQCAVTEKHASGDGHDHSSSQKQFSVFSSRFSVVICRWRCSPLDKPILTTGARRLTTDFLPSLKLRR